MSDTPYQEAYRWAESQPGTMLDFVTVPIESIAALLETNRVLEQLARQSQWQPIETAPKDGTEILLFDRGQICHGYWGGDFHNTFLMVRGVGFADGATHWMPLPSAPNESDSSGQCQWCHSVFNPCQCDQ